MAESFWDPNADEIENLRMGSSYPPVKIYLTSIDLAKLNSADPVMVTAILSDGKEVDLELYLETDRDKFSKDLRGVLDENQDSP